MTNSLLDNRTLIGDTGVSIPSLCFGSSALGDMPDTYGYGVTESRAHDTIRKILHSRFPFIDTSRNYGDGRSEQRIGEVLRDFGGLPDGAQLSTKLDRDPDSGRFDAARARQSLEESLTALGVASVDILHLHDPEYAASIDEITRKDGALPTLVRMKEEGLCQAIGLAAGRVDVMMPLLRDWDFDVLITHNRYTLVNRNASQMIDLAHERGMVVMNAAPFAGGVLAKGVEAHPRYVYQPATDEVLEPVREVINLAKQREVPAGAAALQFSLRDSRIATTLCGVSRPERVDAIIEWAKMEIPQTLWDALAELDIATTDPEANRVPPDQA